MQILYNIKSLAQKIFGEKLSCAIAFNMHDSSVSFAFGNKIVLVLEAERVFREKKKLCSHREMEYLITYGLGLLGKKIDDVSFWTMTTLNNPYLTKFDVIDFEKKKIKEPYWKKIGLLGEERKVLIVNHHLAHAAIYLSTPYRKALIISCDGGGDFNESIGVGECLAIYIGEGNKIVRKDIPPENVITGKTYGACSNFLYGSKYSEGKMMALAGYGKVRKEYYTFLERNLNRIESSSYRRIDRILERNFPHLREKAGSHTDDVKDFAATVHQFFIDKRLENTKYILDKFSGDEEALILTGGASLNLDLNTKILELRPDIKHVVAACCDDTGQSLGALCILINTVFVTKSEIHFPYLGEGLEKFEYTQEAVDGAVDILLNDGIVLLHNGKSEIGPRALGNRSFIARPDNLSVKKKLSEEIKQRESYRPVAPVVLEEKVHDYFIGPEKSPYMLYRYETITSERQKIVGAVHVDQSARVQTVNHENNPFLYDLIKKFGEKTGTYVLLNTSLNLKGEPLTNKIEESQAVYEKIAGPKMLIHNGIPM